MKPTQPLDNDGFVDLMEQRILDTRGVEEAVQLATERAIRRHASEGRKIPIWVKDHVEWVIPTLPAEVPTE